MHYNTIRNLPATAWFTSNIPPVHPGLYQVIAPMDDSKIEWCYFDGHRWGQPHPNKAVAVTLRYRKELPYGRKSFEWRGSPKKTHVFKFKGRTITKKETRLLKALPKRARPKFNSFTLRPAESGVYTVEAHGLKGFSFWDAKQQLWGWFASKKTDVIREGAAEAFQDKNWTVTLD